MVEVQVEEVKEVKEAVISPTFAGGACQMSFIIWRRGTKLMPAERSECISVH
jgi:hypothetical protein